MKIDKIILSSLLLVLLAGCSSQEISDEPTVTGGKSNGQTSTAPKAPVNSSGLTPIAPPSASGDKSKPTPAPGNVSANLYWNLSESVKSQSDDQIAKSAYQILSQNPNDIKALNALAMNNYRKGKYALAKMYLSKAISISPNSGELYNNLGLLQIATDEDKDAIKSFKQAYTLNSNDGVAAANLGSIYVINKDYRKAVIAMEVAYKNGPRDYKIINNYAVALVGTGSANKAKDLYEDALKEQSGNKEILLNYAILLIDHLNDYKEGLSVIDKLRFTGVGPESRNRVNALETKAKAGLKQ